MTTFTTGPARATISSWLGFSGMRSMLALPPNGQSGAQRSEIEPPTHAEAPRELHSI
jgi:hypothetical protein